MTGRPLSSYGLDALTRHLNWTSFGSTCGSFSQEEQRKSLRPFRVGYCPGTFRPVVSTPWLAQGGCRQPAEPPACCPHAHSSPPQTEARQKDAGDGAGKQNSAQA